MLSSFHLQKASAGFVPFAAPPLPFAVQEQPKENMRILFKHTQTVIDEDDNWILFVLVLPRDRPSR